MDTVISSTSLSIDLKFVLDTLKESEPHPDNYDFGPAYTLAMNNHKLAEIKLRRILKAITLSEKRT